MPDNVLNPGDSRIGWLYDDDASTPHLAVMLQDTGEQIVLSVPFRDMGSQHARWFGQGINYGDDPHRTKFAYEPPRIASRRRSTSDSNTASTRPSHTLRESSNLENDVLAQNPQRCPGRSPLPSGKVLPPPDATLAVIKKAVQQRNQITHAGSETTTEFIDETLGAIKDTLRLLDYYRGHDARYPSRIVDRRWLARGGVQPSDYFASG